MQGAIISEVNSAIKALKDSKSLSDWAKRTEISNFENQKQNKNTQLSASFKTIDEAIRTGDWTDEAIEKLENLKTDEYDKILERFSQEELRRSHGILTQAACILARGGSQTNGRTQPSGNDGNAEKQVQQIEGWAKKNGLWYNDYHDSKDGSLEGVIESDGGEFSKVSGSEAMVFMTKNPSKDGVTKAIDASHYPNGPQGLIDKIILHNSLFPETAYETVGFGKDRSGSFRVIVKQKFVSGKTPSPESISKFAQNLGLEKRQGWYYTKDGKRITDLNPKNIIETTDGKFAVVDCDVEFVAKPAQASLTHYTESGKNTTRTHEVTIHSKEEKGITTYTFSDKMTDTKNGGEVKVHNRDAGSGLLKIDSSDIDYEGYAAKGNDDIEDAKRVIDDAFTPVTSDRPFFAVKKVIIAEDGRILGESSDGTRVPLKPEFAEKFSKELSNQNVSQKSDSQAVVSQLTTHLKSMGIEVHGKKDMEEFLKNHDPQELQKMEEQREMEEIKQKAIADGTFMKAPNGKKSNLTEKQWLQTRTKNFKNWFGDWQNDPENASKVVDENGEPLVVYHGGAQNIRVFRSSNKEESNTGFGYYTDPKTGEKIPMDSNRTIFFSSNPFVAESYQVLYALEQLKALLNQVESLISTSENGKIMIDATYIKDWEHYWKTIDQLSEFNPRFTKLKQWLQQLKQEGKKPSEREVDAYQKLLIETYKALQPFTQTYHMNTSSWKNDNAKVKAFLDRYSTPEGIRKLKQGEIPTEIQSLWNVQLKKIANAQKEGTLDMLDNNVSLYAGSGSFNSPIRTLSFDGKTLTIGSNGEHTDITSLSERQIADALEDFRTVNNYALRSFEDEESYNTILKRSEQYAVFLNIRKPLSHDYEGTAQGSGYKESQKYPFGYVAARQVNKAIKDGNDGIVYQNIEDPYLADNYGVFTPNQIKSATDNNGDFSTTNPDIQAFINKYDLPKGELATLSSTLMTKYGNKTIYGDVIQTANYEYTVNYKGAGEFDIIP